MYLCTVERNKRRKRSLFIEIELKNCQKNNCGKPYKFKQSTVKKKKGF